MNKKIALYSLVAAALAACSAEGPVSLGSRGQAQISGKVAAIQYGSSLDNAKAVDVGCGSSPVPSVCAVTKLVERAAAAGAKLVVVPELALGQEYLELTPAAGDQPATDDRWEAGVDFIDHFANVAADLSISLVIHLQTIASMREDAPRYSTQVAFNDGTVAAVHHKFELYATERNSLTPGETVTTFDSPVGKVGLLICADMYGDLRMHQRLVEELGAEVIAVSSYWTVEGGWRWQRAYARNWGVFVVGANTTTGAGLGGGIYDPRGQVLAERVNRVPEVISAELTAND